MGLIGSEPLVIGCSLKRPALRRNAANKEKTKRALQVYEKNPRH